MDQCYREIKASDIKKAIIF